MHQSLVEHQIGERLVIIQHSWGQDHKPSDYQPTKEEIQNGAWDLICHNLMFRGKSMVSMEHYPIKGFYGVNWPTNYGIEDGTDKLRHLYRQTLSLYVAQETSEEASQKILEARIMIHGVPKVCEEFDDTLPITVLLNKTAMEALLHENMIYRKYVQVRVDTPHYDGFYVFKEPHHEFPSGRDLFSVLSHRNLMEILPPLIRQTHSNSLPPFLQQAIYQFLSNVIGRHHLPTKRKNQYQKLKIS